MILFQKRFIKHLKKVIRSSFTKVKSFYVGKRALELMANGYRLTTDVKAPPQHDLTKD